MRYLKKILVGALEAVVGAYLGAVVFLLILGSQATPPATSTPRAELGWHSAIELVTLAAGGVLVLAWWIVPAGAAFSLILKPRIQNWAKSTAILKGGLVGLVLGLMTAVILTLAGSGIPQQTLRMGFVVLPIYCAVWCALYARKAASGAQTSHVT